jgi:acyl-CoA thioesterase I
MTTDQAAYFRCSAERSQVNRRTILLGAGAFVAMHGNGMAQQASKAIAGPGGRPLKLVVFGDSLVAGYQLPASAAFPQQLEVALRALGHKVEVLNAGVSGDTTAAGLDRLAWAVPDDADGVIVELGANDMLRGLDPKAARKNLEKIVTSIKARGKPILLAGMLASGSLGKAYAADFDSIYPDLAKAHDALLYPFFLDGIALRPELNLRDGIHPNAQGVAEIVKRITPLVVTLLERMATQAKS